MRLLVSVVDSSEVTAALAGGADLIDVKDPAAGALGAPGPDTLRAVRALVRRPVELSAALGDVLDQPGTLALAAWAAAQCGAEYVKIGLRGGDGPRGALQALRGVQRVVEPTGTRLVAVAYADAAGAVGLSPAEVAAVARDAGAHGVLLDTAVKNGASSLRLLGEAEVAKWLGAARRQGLLAGLAGALSVREVERAPALGADLVGVRGSACDGGRAGRVSVERVRALRAALGLSVPASPAFPPPPAAPAGAPGGAR